MNDPVDPITHDPRAADPVRLRGDLVAKQEMVEANLRLVVSIAKGSLLRVLDVIAEQDAETPFDVAERRIRNQGISRERVRQIELHPLNTLKALPHTQPLRDAA